MAFAVLLLGLLCSCSNRLYNAVPGKQLPAWTQGYLDIHSINSGRGECTFYILPDGTTMLVDAGEFHTGGSKYPLVEQKPDSLTRPYKVYASYIKKFSPSKTIDYALATHYHMDHIGRIESDYAVADSGYVLTGMMALYDEVPYKTIVDRSYPEYDESKGTQNWKCFVTSVSARDGAKIEKFDLGSESQFVLVNNPQKYPDFKITNLHSNGFIWKDGKAKDCWKGKPVSENGASTGFLLSYGKFDWFAGGDAGNNGRVEKPVARVIGRPIEAMKGHHHMSWHTMTPEMMEIFAPQVVVNQSFYAHQPWPETMKTVQTTAMPEGQVRDVFLTNIHDDTYAEDAETLSKIKAYRGHVVIRVMPGGDQFYVYMLDDTNLECRVKSVYGPYKCN